MKKVINLVKDFSAFPGGRYKANGKYTGEAFRETWLAPPLRDGAYDEVEVVLDGLQGVGISFWDEAFGMLTRKEHIPAKTVDEKLKLTCTDDETLPGVIRKVIMEAR